MSTSTATGVRRGLTVVPSPHWPEALFPQATTEPFAFSDARLLLALCFLFSRVQARQFVFKHFLPGGRIAGLGIQLDALLRDVLGVLAHLVFQPLAFRSKTRLLIHFILAACLNGKLRGVRVFKFLLLSGDAFALQSLCFPACVFQPGNVRFKRLLFFRSSFVLFFKFCAARQHQCAGGRFRFILPNAFGDAGAFGLFKLYLFSSLARLFFIGGFAACIDKLAGFGRIAVFPAGFSAHKQFEIRIMSSGRVAFRGRGAK